MLLTFFFLPAAYPQTAITVNAASRLRNLQGVENGINLDYLMDGGYTTPAIPTSTSLKNMSVSLLRYPGGEKADNYLWSAAPWTAASPRVALPDTVNAWPTKDARFVDKASPEKKLKPVVLDFDELMTMCAATGAQPL
ncbi:MAG TPA: hypothetical protein VM010_02970, partial [Chitinophagaceae bacterium]|nr:hypothetical protein [Chitinophagaceae bacterium]